MAEQFDSIAFEVYINTWVDISSDVMAEPAPKWNRGIMGNGQLDRVGSPGYLTFTLDNSEFNSAQTLGYYSPGHSGVLTGWTAGLPVRLSFTYEGDTYYKFYGRISPDGIQVHPGIKSDRKVDVTVHDYMSQAQRHELKLLTLQENKTIDQVVPSIIASMPIAPLATDYAVGSYTFPTVFDTVRGSTTATAEFQKLANSELGYIYVIGDRTGGETLKVDGSSTRQVSATIIPTTSDGFLLKEDGDHLLKEDGGKLYLNETQTASFTDLELYPGTDIGFGKNLTNRVEVSTYPRRVDAAATTVLFTLQGEIILGVGETKTGYFCRYRDPSGGASYVNGRDMVTPVSGTDYTAGSASGLTDKNAKLTVVATYGTEGVSYDLTNTDAAQIYVTKLQARGKGIYIYDAVKVIYDSTLSQSEHGLLSLNADMKYQNDPTVGEFFANIVLSQSEFPALSVDRAVVFANKNSMSINGFLTLEPGTKIILSESMSGIDNEFFVQGYEAEIVNGDQVWWKPILQNALLSSGPWIWDTSTWDISTIWAPG